MDPVHITDPILRDQPAGGGIFVAVPEIEGGRARVSIRTEITNAGPGTGSCSVRQELYRPDRALAATMETPVSVATGTYQTVAQQIDVAEPMPMVFIASHATFQSSTVDHRLQQLRASPPDAKRQGGRNSEPGAGPLPATPLVPLLRFRASRREGCHVPFSRIHRNRSHPLRHPSLQLQVACAGAPPPTSPPSPSTSI